MAECFIQLCGGLGNQLFQIAAAYAHCNRHELTLAIHPDVGSDKHGTHWHSYLHKCVRHIGSYKNQAGWNEQGFCYSTIPKEAQFLVGYFQSSKYFSDCVSEIRNLFEPPTSLQETVREKYVDLLADPSAIVVHIRRGDYVGLPQYHGILTPEYYKRAVALMKETRPNSKMLVFSDDLPWTRGLDFLADATFVDEPDAATALYLMSQFENYVMSNSTFSWWAVWLGCPAKTVIVPDRWFGSDGPQDYQDIYEPSWIKLSVVPDDTVSPP